jgi:hypothetical protein
VAEFPAGCSPEKVVNAGLTVSEAAGKKVVARHRFYSNIRRSNGGNGYEEKARRQAGAMPV